MRISQLDHNLSGFLRWFNEPVDIFYLNLIDEKILSFAKNHLIFINVNSNHIPWGSITDSQTSALPDCVERNTPVFAQYFAV